MGKQFDEFLQSMSREVGAAITDIRERLVERPWWGESLGDSHIPVETTAPTTLSPLQTPSFQEYARETAAHEKRDERGPQEPDHDR